jgi:nucleoside phosphorylase
MTQVKDIDVAIVTLKKPELLGAKVAFGVSLDSASPRLQRGYHLFEGEFNDERYHHSKYSFVLTVASDDRNVACSNCVNAVLSLYRPKVCILIGMAAGTRAKVGLGDVVIAETVIDTAGGRAEVGGVIPRPEHFSIDQPTKLQLTNYEESWSAGFRSVVDTLKTHRAAPATMSESWMPSFKQGIILADEKLIADGSMEQRRLQNHDQAIALDMESSGFAQACIAQAVPWLIFRGVSDYGDPESKDGAVPNDPNRKNWQPFASLAAAHIARNFLATRYRAEVF